MAVILTPLSLSVGRVTDHNLKTMCIVSYFCRISCLLIELDICLRFYGHTFSIFRDLTGWFSIPLKKIPHKRAGD